MTSKYSRLKGPQGLPKVCKRQPPFCDPILGTPQTFQALVFYQPEGIPDPPPLFNDVLTLMRHPLISNVWIGHLTRDVWKLSFYFSTNELGVDYSGEMIIVEIELESYRSRATGVPFAGTIPYDTLQTQLNNVIGFGASHFRVLL